MQRRGRCEQREQSFFFFFGLCLLKQLGAGVLHDVGDVRRPRHQEQRKVCGGRALDELLRDVALAQVLSDVEDQRGGAAAQECGEEVLEPMLAQRRKPCRDDELAAAQKRHISNVLAEMHPGELVREPRRARQQAQAVAAFRVAVEVLQLDHTAASFEKQYRDGFSSLSLWERGTAKRWRG